MPIRPHASTPRAKEAPRQGGAPRTVGRPPAEPEAVAQRVLETATEQYLRLGFSTVTTDETARAAGVSKKTLYQHFPSKEELLRSVVRENCERHNQSVKAICRDRTCSIGKRLKRMMNYRSKVFGEISPALMHAMRRSAPEAWQQIEQSRQRCIHDDFGALLEEGRKRGDFRKDIDPQIFMMIYAETLRNVINPQAFAQLGTPPQRVFETVYKVLFEGILTDKARKEYT